MTRVTRVEAVEAFVESAGAAPGSQDALVQLLERAALAYPTLDEIGFAARLGTMAARGVRLERVHAGDLALAWSAARGESPAVRAIEESHFDAFDQALRRQGDESFCDEVRQLVRVRAFAPEGRASILWDYDGQGELRGWLRVVGIRTGLDLRRKTRREVSLEEHETPSVRFASADPELAHLRARHASDFQEAFLAALAALGPEDRVALRLYFVDHLTIDQLGALWNVHRVTAARRVNKVRARVVELTKGHLQVRLALSPSELASLLAVLDVDVSLAGALGSSSHAS